MSFDDNLDYKRKETLYANDEVSNEIDDIYEYSNPPAARMGFNIQEIRAFVNDNNDCSLDILEEDELKEAPWFDPLLPR